MARNVEKANLMLNKWTAMKGEMAGPGGGAGGGRAERRPYLASECKALPEAERWRRDVIRDVTRKLADIQNAGLGEARIRDLNDEINKLLREKGHWERQIRALGGANYAAAAAPRLYDGGADGGGGSSGGTEGVELPGGRGYKYFGAARDLPGVKELFADAAAAASSAAASGGTGAEFGGFGSRRRGDVLRGLTPDYFGFRDEDDGVLLPLEARRSAELRAQLHAQWEAAGGADGARKRAKLHGGNASSSSDAAADVASASSSSSVVLADAEGLIAARRRQLLTEKYAAPAPSAGTDGVGAGAAVGARAGAEPGLGLEAGAGVAGAGVGEGTVAAPARPGGIVDDYE